MSKRKVHTLRELEHKTHPPPGGTKAKPLLAHIPSLQNASDAAAMLERLYREFSIIISRRGYSITSISEMCCCGDGLDHNNNNKANSRRRRKKSPASNVLGYNQRHATATTTLSCSIHIRLRKNHSTFYPYEHVAGTMSHEMAHCEVFSHNAKFYKLMNTIQEEHAIFLVTGDYEIATNTTATATNTTATTATNSTNDWMMPQGPQKLGGGSLHTILTPREAAGIAADERRRQQADDIWCMACQPEIVDIEKADTMATATTAAAQVIDLTTDEVTITNVMCDRSFGCSRCTFVNLMGVASCSMCGQEHKS